MIESYVSSGNQYKKFSTVHGRFSLIHDKYNILMTILIKTWVPTYLHGLSWSWIEEYFFGASRCIRQRSRELLYTPKYASGTFSRDIWSRERSPDPGMYLDFQRVSTVVPRFMYKTPWKHLRLSRAPWV